MAVDQHRQSDLSLWDKYEDGYRCYRNEWCYYLISQNNDGRWRWQEIVTDEWDAINEVEIEMIENESNNTFVSWQEAATDCENVNAKWL